MSKKSPKELIKELIKFAKDNRLPVIIHVERSPNAMAAKKIYDGTLISLAKLEPNEISWTEDELTEIYTTKDDW